jgi:hypothetical protein
MTVTPAFPEASSMETPEDISQPRRDSFRASSHEPNTASTAELLAGTDDSGSPKIQGLLSCLGRGGRSGYQ